MKIYTKTGDKGTTSLIGGRRVPKSNIRIDAYGTVDELIAFIGLLRDLINENDIIELLIQIQSNLMSVASQLAAENDSDSSRLPNIKNSDIQQLELKIDEFETELTPLESFVLPGGNQAVSLCHVARTICRRAERKIVKLQIESDTKNNERENLLEMYLNRLSDFFFVLSRKLAKIYSIDEVMWKP